MTEQQAADLIAIATSQAEKLDQVIYFCGITAAVTCIIWGVAFGWIIIQGMGRNEG